MRRPDEFAGQNAGLTVQALIKDGTYASKGTARRALGISMDPLPSQGWLTRLAAGLAGAHPRPPNA